MQMSRVFEAIESNAVWIFLLAMEIPLKKRNNYRLGQKKTLGTYVPRG
jgi:hypothetical protein